MIDRQNHHCSSRCSTKSRPRRSLRPTSPGRSATFFYQERARREHEEAKAQFLATQQRVTFPPSRRKHSKIERFHVIKKAIPRVRYLYAGVRT